MVVLFCLIKKEEEILIQVLCVFDAAEPLSSLFGLCVSCH